MFGFGCLYLIIYTSILYLNASSSFDFSFLFFFLVRAIVSPSLRRFLCFLRDGGGWHAGGIWGEVSLSPPDMAVCAHMNINFLSDIEIWNFCSSFFVFFLKKINNCSPIWLGLRRHFLFRIQIIAHPPVLLGGKQSKVQKLPMVFFFFLLIFFVRLSRLT